MNPPSLPDSTQFHSEASSHEPTASRPRWLSSLIQHLHTASLLERTRTPRQMPCAQGKASLTSLQTPAHAGSHSNQPRPTCTTIQNRFGWQRRHGQDPSHLVENAPGGIVVVEGVGNVGVPVGSRVVDRDGELHLQAAGQEVEEAEFHAAVKGNIIQPGGKRRRDGTPNKNAPM